jgi:hypothetical protein
MWIFIVIVLIVIILVAVVKNDNKQIQINHLQNGGFRKSYPLVTKCLEEEFEMSFFEDSGNSFLYSKKIYTPNNKGTLFIGLKLNSGRETIVFSNFINNNNVQYDGLDVSTIYTEKKYIIGGINCSLEKLNVEGITFKQNEKIEIRSKKDEFIESETSIKVFVETAGTLNKLISKETERSITSLKLSGEIDQMDIWALKIMGDGVDFMTGYNLKKLDLSDAVIYDNLIKDLSFHECKKLEYVKLPNNLLKLENGSFCDCINLKYIDLGDNIETIESYSFDNCINLETIHIGGKLNSIGKNSFSKCNKLSSIYIHSTKPILISEESNEGFPLNKTILYVPKGCKEIYLKNDFWKRFKKIIEYSGSNLDEKLF